MNIKEHIEAGHYPKDDKGRALVPLSDNRTATIFATDAPEAFCIVGKFENWHMPACWDERGGRRDSEKGGPRLLPPPPRKVKRYIGILADAPAGYATEEELREKMQQYTGWTVGVIEYEEPWS